MYPVPFSGMATNDQFLRKSPENAKKWLRAHVRALLFMRQNPDEAAQIAGAENELERDVAQEAIKQAQGFMSTEDPGGSTEQGIRLQIQYSSERLSIDPEKCKDQRRCRFRSAERGPKRNGDSMPRRLPGLPVGWALTANLSATLL